MHLTVPSLIVNIKGDEFGDIVEMNHQVMSQAKADPANGDTFALRVDTNVYLTTGGLKIDPDSHVLTQEGKIIPGLFAAGDVCGSIEQKDGLTYGYGFASAMSFGAVAADTIAKDIK